MKLIFNIILLACFSVSVAQVNRLEFIENKGQWEEKIKFKAKIPAGDLYLEEKGLTYLFYDENDIDRYHRMHHNEIKNLTKQDYTLHLHALRVNFLNSQLSNHETSDMSFDYVNYFIGSDRSKWASNVKKYGKATYKNIYPQTDLKFYQKEGYLKYDFIVHPGGDPDHIAIEFDGAEELYLEDGQLVIKTSVNEIIERKPYVYQMVNGTEKQVKCKFKLRHNVLTFSFPRGYDETRPLVIDPTLVFASYSGSTVDNWGYTSTFDLSGHLYGGGVTFGVGYPITTGAYQTTFSGGDGSYPPGSDITISKFSPNGSTLIYSTYLGGLKNESPHSLVINSNDELLILGSTSSSNFPTTVAAFDTSYNGGTAYTGTIPNYTSGSDIIVSKLSPDGMTLMASTFVGGNGNDGLNISPLAYNYGDVFRGEIIVDANDNCYIASSTNSANFPTTTSAVQTAIGGMQDACAFKMDSNLSTLLWSTFYGGSDDDAAYSIQIDNTLTPHITGGTRSTDFFATPGALNTANQGGTDGFIVKLNPTATVILASTYLGTAAYDQSYFVQLDINDNVYVVGQTEGVYGITPPTVYNVPNSGQFLHKLNPNLTTTVMSTVFGSGSGNIDVTPSAFLVNECNYIQMSFWGGNTNVNHGGPPFSSTTGLPVTTNAIQGVTDGSDYYLMLLSEDADSLLFATFFGGGSSEDHVDGGTSRFDKRGIVYQAVCASCFTATNDFPTTPGAWSSTDNSPNCNLGVFKIDLTRLTADADVYTDPYFCLGDTVHFQNLSNGGVLYEWDFGDGDTSDLYEPTHVFDTAGTYNVMLVAFDSVSCILSDTDYVQIYIFEPPVASIDTVNSICNGDSVQLGAYGGTSYYWVPNYNISNDSIQFPMIWPTVDTKYTVYVEDSCGIDSAEIMVVVNQKNIDIMNDTTICRGQNITLNATGGVNYVWSPGGSLNNPNIQNPVASPFNTTTYNVSITDVNNCTWDTSMVLTIDTVFPDPNAWPDTTICFGDSIQLNASGGNDYSWSPTTGLSDPNIANPFVKPNQTTNYVVAVSNGCGTDYDTVEVIVHVVDADMSDDTTICIGDPAQLWATGGVSYSWTPSQYLNNSSISNPIAYVDQPTYFTVTITDHLNCSTERGILVDTLHKPTVDIGVDIRMEWGDEFVFAPITNGTIYSWSPPYGLNCTDCLNPSANPATTTTYILTVEDANGCKNYDTVTVFIDGSIYLPNSFTPNGDGFNEVFYAIGIDIKDFEMYIFDRWGEAIFYSDDMDKGWDGTYKGRLAKTDTYVWKVTYVDAYDVEGELYGTVTLIR